jgi:very-short-patch-repair endonuclease
MPERRATPPKIFNRKPLKVRRQQLRKTMTSPEIILWMKLRGRQMNGYKFRRQFSVLNYVVDFYCSELKLAIEIDGESHFVNDARNFDLVRQQSLEKHGVKFVRFTNEEVTRNIDGVWRKIFEITETIAKSKTHSARSTVEKPPPTPP